MVGPSDYWRESAATWIFGAAVACWLASDDLRRRLDGPVGCVLIYERVERALTPDAKWAAAGLSGP
jgi:hypothetical protein